jgi:hypothetical protein
VGTEPGLCKCVIQTCIIDLSRGLRLHFDEGIWLEFGERGFIRACFSWPIRLIGKKLKVQWIRFVMGGLNNLLDWNMRIHIT